MSDQTADQHTVEKTQGPNIVAQLIITLTDQGQLSVHGSTADIIGVYGLLERAKDIVRATHAKAARDAQPKILVPSLLLPK
jgi:hypothetical protein